MRWIRIFDTTLRDGEQTPGVNLSGEEKLRIAKQLSKLGVDVIEAGFPATSKGELNAVKKIAENVHGPVIAALAKLSPVASYALVAILSFRVFASFFHFCRSPPQYRSLLPKSSTPPPVVKLSPIVVMAASSSAMIPV